MGSRVVLKQIKNIAAKTPKGCLDKKPEPLRIPCDYIGPPDKTSNLRPYVYAVQKSETELEAKYRAKRMEVDKWNESIWAQHNLAFYEEKQNFINLHKLESDSEISADKLSTFYKVFLEKNRERHIRYNVSWYKKNFELLLLAFQIKIQSFFK